MMRRLNWCGSVITLLMENVSTISDVQYVIKNIHPTNQPHTLKSTYNILLFSFFYLISSSGSADNWRQTNKKWKTLPDSKSQQSSKIIMSDFSADFGGGGTDKFCKIVVDRHLWGPIRPNFEISACILCVYNFPDSRNDKSSIS